MLAHEQVQVGVVGHAVALVARPHDLLDTAGGRPLAAHVAGHVAEQEVLVARVPDRALGEGETGAELLDLDVLVDELGQLLGSDVYGHVRSFLGAESGLEPNRPAGTAAGPPPWPAA